jgi:hypothetical protein
VIDFVGSGVIEVFPLKEDPELPIFFAQPFRLIERSRPALEIPADPKKLGSERRIVLKLGVGLPHLGEGFLKFLGKVGSPEMAIVAILVRIVLLVRLEINPVQLHLVFFLRDKKAPSFKGAYISARYHLDSVRKN